MVLLQFWKTVAKKNATVPHHKLRCCGFLIRTACQMSALDCGPLSISLAQIHKVKYYKGGQHGDCMPWMFFFFLDVFGGGLYCYLEEHILCVFSSSHVVLHGDHECSLWYVRDNLGHDDTSHPSEGYLKDTRVPVSASGTNSFCCILYFYHEAEMTGSEAILCFQQALKGFTNQSHP